MRIVEKAIEELRPAPYNPRVIDDWTKERLKASVEAFGLVEPLVWNKRTGHVVGGNQRLEVLKELGYEKIPVVEINVDLATEKKLNVALNKIQGGWDLEKLADILNEFDDSDVELMGFRFDEVAEIMESLSEDIEKALEDFDETITGVIPEKRYEVVLSFLTKEDANEWLEKHGFKERVKKYTTLIKMEEYL